MTTFSTQLKLKFIDNNQQTVAFFIKNICTVILTAERLTEGLLLQGKQTKAWQRRHGDYITSNQLEVLH